MDDFFRQDPDEPGSATGEAETTIAPAAGARSRKPRPPVNPNDRRQLMIRRGIAIGVGVVIFILLVLGVRSCLDARSDRALEEYAGNVTQIVDETNTLGETMFETIGSPGDLSITDFTGEIETDRNAMDGFLTRVEKLDTPGGMEAPQRSLELGYQIRADAMGVIAAKMPTALGDEGSEKAVREIAGAIDALEAADVIFNRVTRHQIDGEIESSGADAPEQPRAQFVPGGEDWTDPDTISDALATVGGGTPEADDSGIHGTGISSVSIGGVALDEAVDNTVPAGTDPTVEVSVQNQGEGEESDISVTVSTDAGDSGEGTIDTLGIGETGVATISLESAPTGSVTLTVEVDAVPGESLLDNNEATYTVTFE